MMQRSLVLIKPDGVSRGLTGEVVRRLEKEKLKVVGVKMLKPSKELISKHYPEEESYLISLGKKSQGAGDKILDFKEQGMMIVNALRDYLSESTIIAMAVQGEDAIPKIREIAGHTNPKEAKPGTIRGDFADDDILTANKEKRAVRNLVHASGNEEEAENELKLWFKNEELHDY